jgi:hypothetical protein
MIENLDHGSEFVFEIINMLGKVPTQAVLDRIKAEVRLTRGNLRTLIEAMELAGASTARSAHIDDAPDLSSIDAAFQLKHALEDMLREVEKANG